MESCVDKKTYRPIVLWSIMLPIILAMIGAYFYGFLGFAFLLPGLDSTGYARWVEILFAVTCFIMTLFLSWLLIDSILRQKIELTDCEVYAPQNTCFKRSSYQWEVHIPYAEISDITCKCSTMTSDDQGGFYERLPKDWAIFKMKDGKVKRLCIGLYTRKTEILILDDIIARCAAVGNVLGVSCGKDILKRNKKRKSSDKIAKN